MERRPKPYPSVIGRAKQILGYLTNYESFLFTFFMCDVLERLTTLSLHFQKDSLSACDAVEHLEALFLNLVSIQQHTGPRMSLAIETSVNGEGSYKGVELKGFSHTTLLEERKKVTGKY